MVELQRDKRDSAQYRHLRKRILRGRPDCALCGEPINYQAHHLDPDAPQIDHVVPVAHGGQHVFDNLLPVHRTCNRAKSDKLPAGAAALTTLSTRTATASSTVVPSRPLHTMPRHP